MPEITVETSFGTLVATVGGDEEYPEILVYLRRKKEDTRNGELMLCAVTDNSVSEDEDVLRIAVYGDPQAEDYTERFVFTHEEVEDPKAMWQ